MSTVLYDAFLPEVSPYCMGVPDHIAINAIRNSAIDLLDASHWLTYECFPATGTANVADYQLDMPADTEIARVIDAWYGTLSLKPKSEQQLNAMFQIDWRTQVSSPRYYTQLDDQTVRLVPMPSLTETGMFKALVVLRPTRDSDEIDSRVYSRWLEPIAQGARARLYEMTGQSFSNVRLAEEAWKKYRAGLALAKIDRNRGQTTAPLSFRPPRFV